MQSTNDNVRSLAEARERAKRAASSTSPEMVYAFQALLDVVEDQEARLEELRQTLRKTLRLLAKVGNEE